MNLSFRLGKVPIRIAPSFFLMTVFLGGLGANLSGLLAWVVIVLASVIVHELGHASMGRAFGLEPRIDLHGMGGTTSWAIPKQLSAGKRIAISLAGPGAGFCAGALVWIAGMVIRSSPDSSASNFLESPLGAYVFASLLFVNIGWGVLNLLPMLPLDGGNVMAQLLNIVTHGRGERPSRVISIAVAGAALVAAAAFPRWRSWWTALLAISFILSNWRGLKDQKAREHDAPLHESLQGAYAALDAKDSARVLELARPVALGARTAPVRAEALQLLAFAFLFDGRVADADAAIAALPRGYSPHPSLLELRASSPGAGAAPPAPTA
jgi:Zn-dependent protease